MAIYWDELLHNGYQSVKEMITKMHWEENLTIEEMSDKLGVSHSTLKIKIKKLEIVMKPKGGIPYSKNPEGGPNGHANRSM